MDKKSFQEALKKVKESSTKRNFSQTFDLIINLTGLDMKKPDHQVDLFVLLPHGKGKPNKICALIGPELKETASQNCDSFVLVDDFNKYKADKKLAKKLAEENNFFVAQANLMGQVAGAFGRVLGPRNKMPNPKGGCVVPPKANLKPLKEKLDKTIRVMAKLKPCVQTLVGSEAMNDDQVTDNALAVYNAVVHALPGEKNNIRSIYLKLTMGKPVEVK